MGIEPTATELKVRCPASRANGPKLSRVLVTYFPARHCRVQSTFKVLLFLVMPSHCSPVGGLPLGVAGRHLGALPPARAHQGRKFQPPLDQVLSHAHAAYAAGGALAQIAGLGCVPYRLAIAVPYPVQQRLDAVVGQLLLLDGVVGHLFRYKWGRGV